MKPVVFTIPILGHDVPGYGLMLMVAFLASIWWATKRASRSGANPDVILNLGFLALIAGVVGCRTMYVIHYWDQFASRGNWLDVLIGIVDVRRGGLEFYGGLVLATVLAPLWLKFRERVSVRWYLDIVAPSVALGLAIGRIGCFLNGCCYGGVCELPWAVTFPAGSPAAVTQWQRELPGAELPDPLTVKLRGKTEPLPRECFMVSDEEIAVAQQHVLPVLEIQDELARATDAAQRRELEQKLSEAQRAAAAGLRESGLGGCRSAAVEAGAYMAYSMRQHGVSADEIRALAAQSRSLPVHPTQLYSTITALIIAFLLSALYWRRTRDGQVIFTLLLIEPVTRYLLEVIRADNPTDTLGRFTISQGLALLMTLIGAAGLIWLRRQPPRSPAAQRWTPETADQPQPD